MITSTLDADVALILADRTHAWATTLVDDVQAEYCVRCSHLQADLKDPDAPATFLPCRGFPC